MTIKQVATLQTAIDIALAAIFLASMVAIYAMMLHR
jgi:hypothetical protein